MTLFERVARSHRLLEMQSSARNYGNSAEYLLRRLKRDRPDLVERVASGEIRSARAAAIEAGVPWTPKVDQEDRRLEALLGAWKRASLVDRQIFLSLAEEEIDAACAGRLLNAGPRFWHYSPAPGFELPDLEALADLHGVSGAARLLGVSVRSVMRWRAGKTRPSPVMLKKISDTRMSETNKDRPTEAG